MEKIEPEKIKKTDYHMSQPEFVREGLAEESFFRMIDDGLRRELFELNEQYDPQTGRILEQNIINKKTGEILFSQVYENADGSRQPIHFRKMEKNI